MNNSSFTAAQWSAINSGITSALVAKIHEHSNKAVLDGITSDNVSNWNNKRDNQTVGSVSEPVYLENGIAKIATGVATKTDLNNLTEVVNGHTTEIGQIKDDVAGIDVHYNLYKKYAVNITSNKFKKNVISLSEPAYNVRGWISVMPENGGASIMPLKAGETDYVTYTGSWDKVSNNINNSNLPRNSYTFIPFAWTTDYPIVAIGIKGNGEVDIGHAFVETIK